MGVYGASRYVDSCLAGGTVLVHAHSSMPGYRRHSQPFPTPSNRFPICLPLSLSLSLSSFLPRPPDATSLVPVSFLPFSSPLYLLTYPLFIRAPRPVHVHTPSLTLSATTSVLHSKALTSETSASTPEDGFIGYSSPCGAGACEATGQTESFNRDGSEVV